MNATSQSTEDLQWSGLLKQLPGVRDARIIRDEAGRLTEIHILSGTKRTPKQIVRDVQSALSTQFGAEIDYRIISVAQVADGKPDAARARLRLSGLTLSLTDNSCEATVRLELGGTEYTGSSTDELARARRYTCCAAAAVAALNHLLPDSDRLVLEEVSFPSIAGKPAILTVLTLREGKQADQLLGCVADRDDGGLSAVRAVLDAVNRKLDIII